MVNFLNFPVAIEYDISKDLILFYNSLDILYISLVMESPTEFPAVSY